MKRQLGQFVSTIWRVFYYFIFVLAWWIQKRDSSFRVVFLKIVYLIWTHCWSSQLSVVNYWRTLANTKYNQSNIGPNRSKGDRSPGKYFLAAMTSTKSIKCVFCDRDHSIYRCFAFKKRLCVAEWWEYVASKKICFMCHSAEHLVGACQ